ncbi:MAG: MBL fold metallo-hydrolase [Clostridia bacterium]|nr:MBL fold metallo-hydrolase [Clostridia bacterium]
MAVKTLVLGPLATNCYIYTDDKTGKMAVVDPAFQCAQLLSLKPDYIFITHAHADHIMAAASLKALSGAKVVCTKAEAVRMQSSRDSLYDAIGIYSDEFVPVDADVIVCDGDEILVGDTAFKIMQTPGHTDGSVCFITDGIIFSGDTMFCGSCGRTDFPSGNLQQMLESFRRLFALEGDYTVYSGHGEATTLSVERKTNPLVRLI